MQNLNNYVGKDLVEYLRKRYWEEPKYNVIVKYIITYLVYWGM